MENKIEYLSIRNLLGQDLRSGGINRKFQAGIGIERAGDQARI